MNALFVGTRKTTILGHLPDKYLLIDDGGLIDAIEPPARRTITAFDVDKHSFNPLKDITYKRARDFISALDAVFPEGESTLTRKNANFILLQSLLSKPDRLDNLTYPTHGASKEGLLDAAQKIDTLLLSPILSRVLTRPTNLSFKGTIHARLNRAEIGDFDCFVIANFLVAQYPGTVVVPDFGFYAHAGYSSLIRQGRLIAGINAFSEVPQFEPLLLTIERKVASRCNAKDAATLALYAGLLPATNGYNEFIDACIH